MVREFEGGQCDFGFQGLCAKAEDNEKILRLMGGWLPRLSTETLKPLSVKVEHCEIQNALRVRKSSPLFNFTHVKLETKLQMLGRCGITDVESSAPFEKVLKKVKLEGVHIQLWLVVLEKSFEKTTGYGPELMHFLFADDEEGARPREVVLKQVVAAVRNP